MGQGPAGPASGEGIRAVVSAIEVDDKAIRIIGNKDILQAVIAGKQTANGNVRGFVRKWRTWNGSNGFSNFRVSGASGWGGRGTQPETTQAQPTEKPDEIRQHR